MLKESLILLFSYLYEVKTCCNTLKEIAAIKSID